MPEGERCVYMYRVVIVDDEAEQAQHLSQMVSASPALGDAGVTVLSGYDELCSYLGGQGCGKVDILLTDICLSAHGEGVDGIELVRRLFPARCGTQVVYVTAFDDYHSRVYQTPHTYFLKKPAVQAELDEALSTCVCRLREYVERPLRVRSHHTERVLFPRSIIFVESQKRVLSIHVAQGPVSPQGVSQEVVQTYAKLSAILEELPSCFIRVHKSYAVNMDYISEFSTTGIVLMSGEKIPVSRDRRPEAYRRFIEYVRGCD